MTHNCDTAARPQARLARRAIAGLLLLTACTLASAQVQVTNFVLNDATNLTPGTYKIYVMGNGTAGNGTPITLQPDGSWAAPPSGAGTLTLPCYEFTSTPRQISQIQMGSGNQGFSARAYYFVVTDFAKFPSCNPTGGHTGLFNNPFGFTYTYPTPGGAFALTQPPPQIVANQTFPAWTFSELGASATAGTNDLSQVDFVAFPMNMQSTVPVASPPNPPVVGNPVGPSNPGLAVNHASIRDAYAQWAGALAQAAGPACSGVTPPPACEWQKMLQDIPPSPPQSTIPQYLLLNPGLYLSLSANSGSSLHTYFDSVISTLWAASGAPTLTLNSGGAYGNIPQDTFTSSIVTINYPTFPAGSYPIRAMKFVGNASGYIAYVFDPKGFQTGCETLAIVPQQPYCSNPPTTGYQVFAGAGALAGPVNADNWTTLTGPPLQIKAGTTLAEYNGLASRLAFLVAGAINRGVALASCTGKQTWQCWQDQTYWYPTATSSTFPNITQNLFSYWMHTAAIQGTPMMVQPPGAVSPATGVPGGSSVKMGMAYGFSDDENSTPPAVATQPEVPSKFDNTIVYGGTASITFGPWVTTSMLLVAVAPSGGGTVTSTPSGIACNPTCSRSYANGTAVTLTAAPASGYVFTNWSGACSGAATTCSVTISGVTSVVANFTAIAPTSYALNVVVSGLGSVSSGPPGISCPGLACSAAFPLNASVTLTAVPAPGATFAGWNGACTGTAITCTVTMSQARNVGASFTSATQATLTVQGGVGGIVTTVPGGIDCGTTCIAGFPIGTAVSVVATPTAGYQFTGWGGACSGTNTCDLVMSGNMSVTAAFSLAPPGQFSLNIIDFGNGTVTSAPAGIACGTACATTFPAGTLVMLTAVPSAGNAFAGWGGACTGLGVCFVLMDQVRSVEASFISNAPPPVVQQVPTLSQWALMLLALLIGIVAVAHRGRRT